MEPTFFESAAAFRKWLARNHDSAGELLVGFYKVGSGFGGITYRQALDEALCFGWIDGVRRARDATSYSQRFSPRKPRSQWSAVNIKRVAELTKLGRMQRAGIAAFEAREESTANQYSYENTRSLAEAYEAKLRANAKAWRYWEKQPPSYKRTASWYVMSAKQESTRQRRLSTLIDDCEHGRRLAASTPASRRAPRET